MPAPRTKISLKELSTLISSSYEIEKEDCIFPGLDATLSALLLTSASSA